MKLSRLCFLHTKKRISKRLFHVIKSMILRRRRREGLEDEGALNAFDLDQFSRKECRKFFLFRKADLRRLRVALGIPGMLQTSEEDKVPEIEGLRILLRRLAYPNRWMELWRLFGRSQGALSRIFYHVLFHINSEFKHLLQSWNLPWLTEDVVAVFSGAISQKGGVLPFCFGFIDGTAHPIARPIRNQKLLYSGHKRIHCVKWQAIILPNGR